MEEKTMTAVRFKGKGDIALEQLPIPEPHGQDVVVKMKAAAICGTDRENLMGEGQDTVPGHESAGQVVATDSPTWARTGMRVAINCHITCRSCPHCVNGDLYFCDQLKVVGFDIDGGFAEYLLVPEQCCMPLPEDISYEMGSLLVDMLGTSYRGVSRSGLRPGSKAAVWGAGPIGLSAMLSARRIGAEVAMIDFNDYRLKMASSLGADLTINPQSQEPVETLISWSGGRGLDSGLDCVGLEIATRQAIAAVMNRGTVIIAGVSHSLTVNPWEDLICRELTLLGTRSFTLAQFDQMISAVRHGLPAEKIVTHRFHIDQAEEAFRVFRSGECGKILFVE